MSRRSDGGGEVRIVTRTPAGSPLSLTSLPDFRPVPLRGKPGSTSRDVAESTPQPVTFAGEHVNGGLGVAVSVHDVAERISLPRPIKRLGQEHAGISDRDAFGGLKETTPVVVVNLPGGPQSALRPSDGVTSQEI